MNLPFPLSRKHKTFSSKAISYGGPTIRRIFFFMELKIKNNPQFKQGYLYAVRLLAASKKSEREVSKRLLEKGYPEETVEQVVGELRSQKLLSDRKLVDETIQGAIYAKRYGRRRIFLELKKRGIGSAQIEKALEDYPKATERETAHTLAQERWEKLKKVEYQKRKKRLYDFLLNRGFDFELAREIVNQMQSDIHEDF